MARLNVADLAKRIDLQDFTINLIREEFTAFRKAEDERWNKLLGEVHAFLNDDKPQGAPKPQENQGQMDPWRMKLEDFVGFRDGCKADWSDNGNARVAQRLSKHLKRTSGHAEGQLYINWCEKVGKPVVKAFWSSMGFSDIPEGL